MLLQDTDLIGRTSEFARVFGIEFVSVLTRGSQYRVESMMFRVALPENFVLISPSRKQVSASMLIQKVAQMRAIECIPLIMEPQSRFYTSPILVLDFQSLYPSIMIAHNHCFSTCIGRVKQLGGPQKLGVMDDYEIPMEQLELLKDHVNGKDFLDALTILVSPNGVVFVKQHIRRGVLGRMLAEILETRVMIKKSMKHYKDQKVAFYFVYLIILTGPFENDGSAPAGT